jgi:hypothetical protein
MSCRNWLPYLSRHGLPWPSVESPATPHFTIAPMNVLLSLPPIVIVTSCVPFRSASSWGATPGYWLCLKSLVSAAPQVTSVSRAPVLAAMTCG